MIAEIEAKLNEVWERKRTVYPCHTNRASQLGAPCVRQLVYYRTEWDKQALPDINSIKAFEEGHLQEEAVKRLLMDAGFQIIEAQRSVADALFKKHNISGHLDFFLGGNGIPKPILCEVKSMSPNIFKQMNAIEDLERYPWTRKYRAQMMLYLLGSGEESGLFVFKNKSTGEIRLIEAAIDLGYAESLLAKANEIEGFVKAKTLPDRITDTKECDHCPFKHLCLPDVVNQAAALISDPEFEAMLARRDELDDARREYSTLDDEIKATVKSMPESQVVAGNWLIEKKTGRWTEYKVPEEIKKQYASFGERVTISIKKLAE